MEKPKSFKTAFPRWVELQHERSEQRESLRRTVLLELDAALDTLSVTYSWDEIYLFGSITREGRFSSRSDIDIGIRGLNKFHHFSFVGELSSILGRDADVIRLEDCHFSNSITAGGIRWRSKKDLLSF